MKRHDTLRTLPKTEVFGGEPLKNECFAGKSVPAPARVKHRKGTDKNARFFEAPLVLQQKKLKGFYMIDNEDQKIADAEIKQLTAYFGQLPFIRGDENYLDQNYFDADNGYRIKVLDMYQDRRHRFENLFPSDEVLDLLGIDEITQADEEAIHATEGTSKGFRYFLKKLEGKFHSSDTCCDEFLKEYANGKFSCRFAVEQGNKDNLIWNFNANIGVPVVQHTNCRNFYEAFCYFARKKKALETFSSELSNMLNDDNYKPLREFFAGFHGDKKNPVREKGFFTIFIYPQISKTVKIFFIDFFGEEGKKAKLERYEIKELFYNFYLAADPSNGPNGKCFFEYIFKDGVTNEVFPYKFFEYFIGLEVVLEKRIPEDIFCSLPFDKVLCSVLSLKIQLREKELNKKNQRKQNGDKDHEIPDDNYKKIKNSVCKMFANKYRDLIDKAKSDKELKDKMDSQYLGAYDKANILYAYAPLSSVEKNKCLNFILGTKPEPFEEEMIVNDMLPYRVEVEYAKALNDIKPNIIDMLLELYPAEAVRDAAGKFFGEKTIDEIIALIKPFAEAKRTKTAYEKDELYKIHYELYGKNYDYSYFLKKTKEIHDAVFDLKKIKKIALMNIFKIKFPGAKEKPFVNRLGAINFGTLYNYLEVYLRSKNDSECHGSNLFKNYRTSLKLKIVKETSGFVYGNFTTRIKKVKEEFDKHPFMRFSRDDFFG